MLPKILCIGAQKAGTSWLHVNLSKNPSIWVPPFKEVHFFDHKFIPENRKWTPWHIRKNANKLRRTWRQENKLTAERAQYLDDITTKPMFNGNWYKKVFLPCPPEMFGLDVTPEYASLPKEGIQFVVKFLGPNTKAIYIIREPVQRAISQLKMNMLHHRLSPSSEKDWLNLIEDPAISDRGNYATHVPRWQTYFNNDNLLFIPFKMIQTSPQTVLNTIEEFAGLPNGTYPNSHLKVFASQDHIKIPQFVEEHFNEMHKSQSDFLLSHFGKNFVEQC